MTARGTERRQPRNRFLHFAIKERRSGIDRRARVAPAYPMVSLYRNQ